VSAFALRVTTRKARGSSGARGALAGKMGQTGRSEAGVAYCGAEWRATVGCAKGHGTQRS
jgi:hypothetical protein